MLLVIQNNICCIQKNLKSKRIGNFNMARFESSNCLSLTELHLDLFQMVAHCHQQYFLYFQTFYCFKHLPLAQKLKTKHFKILVVLCHSTTQIEKFEQPVNMFNIIFFTQTPYNYDFNSFHKCTCSIQMMNCQICQYILKD